jgi:hypothetical protein
MQWFHNIEPEVIFVNHYRYVYDIDETYLEYNSYRECVRMIKAGEAKSFFPRGGRTCVMLEKNGIKSQGWSTCSMDDPFSRKRGYSIAYGRALKNLGGIIRCGENTVVNSK